MSGVLAPDQTIRHPLYGRGVIITVIHNPLPSRPPKYRCTFPRQFGDLVRVCFPDDLTVVLAAPGDRPTLKVIEHPLVVA